MTGFPPHGYPDGGGGVLPTSEQAGTSGPQARSRLPLHVLLFIATLASTTFVGLGNPPSLVNGLSYGVPVMAILLCHEMGHYVMARRYRVPASLPYFIPLPITIFGTLGALIRMKGRIYGRRALFDIGIAGPLAGLAVAIPVTYFGLTLSQVQTLADMPSGTYTLGEPLLFRWLTRLALGEIPPDAGTILHPLAFAGWAGLFVTAFNLIPVGQLDGGHVMHALLPRRSYAIGWLALAGLLLASMRFLGWGVLAALIFILGGPRHPPVASYEELGPGRVWLGLLGLILLVLTFTPQPIGLLP